MSSAYHSERDALLGDELLQSFGSIGIADKDPETDRPVRLRSFRRNVRRCKVALAWGLTAALASGIAHITSLPIPKLSDLREPLRNPVWLNTARWGTDAVILIFTVGLHMAP